MDTIQSKEPENKEQTAKSEVKSPKANKFKPRREFTQSLGELLRNTPGFDKLPKFIYRKKAVQQWKKAK